MTFFGGARSCIGYRFAFSVHSTSACRADLLFFLHNLYNESTDLHTCVRLRIQYGRFGREVREAVKRCNSSVYQGRQRGGCPDASHRQSL